MQDISINVVGAGAIGHLWFSFLTKHGIKSTLYSRKIVNSKKLRVESPDAKFEILINYRTLTQWRNADVILICVKAHQLDQLCQQLASKVSQTCPVILMMNGMGLTEIVQQYLPDNPCLHAYVVHGAYLKDQRLVHTGNGETSLGNLRGSYSESDFTKLISVLNTALAPVTWNSQHYQAMLLKLLINAVINPVTALLDIQNGDIVNNGELIPECESLLQEVTPLLPLIGFTTSTQQLRQKIIEVAINTQYNTSSMRQDVLKGRYTEIDFINGYLIKLAAQRDISLTQHQAIVSQIKTLKA